MFCWEENNLESSNPNKADIIASPKKIDSNFQSYSGKSQSYLDVEIPFLTALKSKKLIILFVMLILGIGSVISNLNNISFIYQAILSETDSESQSQNEVVNIIYKDKNMFLYFILYFIFNSFTRLISGLFLDFLIKRKKFIYYIIFFSLIGLVSQGLGVIMDKNVLLISIALAGATHGGYMTFTPVFVRNEYGLKNMGKILGFLTTGCAIGSLIISDFIFIAPYEYYQKNDSKCEGIKCFYPSYIITSVLFLINILFSLILLREKTKEYNARIK